MLATPWQLRRRSAWQRRAAWVPAAAPIVGGVWREAKSSWVHRSGRDSSILHPGRGDENVYRKRFQNADLESAASIHRCARLTAETRLELASLLRQGRR